MGIVATLISTPILIHILFCCAPKASYYFHRSVLLRMFEMLLMSVWYYLLLINIRNGKDLIMSMLFLFLLFFFLCRNGYYLYEVNSDKFRMFSDTTKLIIEVALGSNLVLILYIEIAVLCMI